MYTCTGVGVLMRAPHPHPPCTMYVRMYVFCGFMCVYVCISLWGDLLASLNDAGMCRTRTCAVIWPYEVTERSMYTLHLHCIKTHVSITDQIHTSLCVYVCIPIRVGTRGEEVGSAINQQRKQNLAIAAECQ